MVKMVGEKVQGYDKKVRREFKGLDNIRGTYAFESGAVAVASTESMSTAEGDNFLIVEAHSVKDVADVPGSLGSVGKTTIGGAAGNIFVDTAWSPWDDRTAHFLNCTHTGEGPEIRVADPREFGLDRFEVVASVFETGIGTVVTFRSKTLYEQKG